MKILSFEQIPHQPKTGMIVGMGSTGVKVTHLASGLSASCVKHRHQYQNKDAALDLLRHKLKTGGFSD